MTSVNITKLRQHLEYKPGHLLRVAFEMKFIKIFLLFLFSFNHSYAADVLAEISAQLVKTPITQGNFQQEKRLTILRKPLLSSGSFTYHQSKGVIWKTLTPVASLLLVNDTHLLTAQGEQAVPTAFGKVFKAMLGGDLNQLNDSFSIIGSDLEPHWLIELQPKDEFLKKIISSIVLSGDNELRQLEIQEAAGNLTRIKFAQIAHPARLTIEQEADFEQLSP